MAEIELSPKTKRLIARNRKHNWIPIPEMEAQRLEEEEAEERVRQVEWDRWVGKTLPKHPKRCRNMSIIQVPSRSKKKTFYAFCNDCGWYSAVSNREHKVLIEAERHTGSE